MRRSGLRLTAGMIGALALGLLGPLQRAVSVQSRTVVEVSGPSYEGSDPHMWRSSQRSREGAGASWRIDREDGTWSYITLVAVRALHTHADVSSHPDVHLRVGSERLAYLEIRACEWYEEYGERFGSCAKHRLWKGDDTFRREHLSERATFSGTLVDAEGTTCTVEATWVARDDAEIPTYANGRSRRPATFDMRSSCLGEHHRRGPNDAEIWTDHVVQP